MSDSVCEVSFTGARRPYKDDAFRVINEREFSCGEDLLFGYGSREIKIEGIKSFYLREFSLRDAGLDLTFKLSAAFLREEPDKEFLVGDIFFACGFNAGFIVFERCVEMKIVEHFFNVFGSA